MNSAFILVSLCLIVLTIPGSTHAYNALEPVLSESAMRLHHLGHHAAYMEKLNTALRELRNRGGAEKELAKLGIDILLARLDEVPEDLRTAIRNNGGGYVNHDLYFKSMSPPSPNNTDGSAPGPRVPTDDSKIALAIVRDFGSFEAFQEEFINKANSVFGSGWVFLYLDGETKTLKLRTTANQDNPTILDKNFHHVHLMCLDLWEHAYYPDFKNKRTDFINQWWSIVNWKQIDTTYNSFLTYESIMSEMAEKRKAKEEAKDGL